jgi:hypothetical protein
MSSILSRQFAAHAASLRAQPEAAPRPATSRSAATLDTASVQAFARELRQWRASPEASAFAASLGGRDVEEIRAYLEGVARGPHFAETRKFSLGGLLSGLIPKAFSIGFAGQIELGIGLYGSVGYIHDLSLEGAGGVYLLGADAKGLEAAADLSIQGGLWMKPSDEVSGSYTGGGLDIDDVFGVSGFVLREEDDEDPKAYLVDIDGGIADGATKLKFHMWTYGIGHDPVAQKPAGHMVILKSLQCLDTSESGHDEVYLSFTIDGGDTQYRYPTWSYYAMKPGDADAVWNLGRSVWCDKKTDVSVYDHDSSVGINAADLIASFTVNVADFAGTGDSHQKAYKYAKGGTSYTLTAYLMDLSL